MLTFNTPEQPPYKNTEFTTFSVEGMENIMVSLSPLSAGRRKARSFNWWMRGCVTDMSVQSQSGQTPLKPVIRKLEGNNLEAIVASCILFRKHYKGKCRKRNALGEERFLLMGSKTCEWKKRIFKYIKSISNWKMKASSKRRVSG